jgi:hypothetical protein
MSDEEYRDRWFNDRNEATPESRPQMRAACPWRKSPCKRTRQVVNNRMTPDRVFRTAILTVDTEWDPA